MRTDLDVSFGGESILSVDPRIYVDEIKEEPALAIETMKRPGYGTIPVSTPGLDSCSVTVTVLVKEKDRNSRAAVIRKILGWATAGADLLEISTRPGQWIGAQCAKLPSIQHFQWSSRLEITFTSYWESYWADSEFSGHVIESTASANNYVDVVGIGTRDGFLEAEITVNSGTLATLTITVEIDGRDDQSMTFAGLSETSAVNILYDHVTHLLCVTDSNGDSLLSKRTAASADDLRTSCTGVNRVYVTANVDCTATIYARGLWV